MECNVYFTQLSFYVFSSHNFLCLAANPSGQMLLNRCAYSWVQISARTLLQQRQLTMHAYNCSCHTIGETSFGIFFINGLCVKLLNFNLLHVNILNLTLAVNFGQFNVKPLLEMCATNALAKPLKTQKIATFCFQAL